jgi:hypothetical protein
MQNEWMREGADQQQSVRVGHWPVPAPTTSSDWRPARCLVNLGL